MIPRCRRPSGSIARSSKRRSGRSRKAKCGSSRRACMLQRQERLRTEGLNTPNDIDNAKAEVDSLLARIASAQEQVKVAESQIAMQQTAIDDTVIRAPFSGVAHLERCAGRRDGLPGFGGRRLHAHRHQHHRRHDVARDRSRRQRELHQPRARRPAGHRGARRLPRLGRFRRA